MILRDYQQRAIDDLYQWFSDGNKGNPCLVLPTGSGKSHIVAALCKNAVQSWPDTRILMLTHVKELIDQNSEKMRQHWPGAPMGIYSASVGRRELGEPITFAGIQSVRNRAAQIGHIDLCIVDECHLISHRNQGGYRKLINDLSEINPAIRVVGLTATPYRLGHGLITDGEALFDALLDPVTIEELIYKGHLAPLRSKVTKEKLGTDGVHKRGGEYIERELQAAVDTVDHNQKVVAEVISLAGSRKSWLFFCAGVDHAEHIRDCLRDNGVTAEMVTGATPKKERERIIDDYKSGRITALTNCSVLTTGFDYPDIDLIAMLRPTLSPGLYVQMAGRGLRPKSHTDHCLVLDFAGVVAAHGPITAVEPPKKGGAGEGDAPVKICDNCGELVHLSLRTCPGCGNEFPEQEKPDLSLRNDDIMGIEGTDMDVTGWYWRKHISRASGKEMLCVTYYGALSDKPIHEYFPVTHGGYAGQKAVRAVTEIATRSKATHIFESEDLEYIASELSDSAPPDQISFKKDGKYFRVISRRWNDETQAA